MQRQQPPQHTVLRQLSILLEVARLIRQVLEDHVSLFVLVLAQTNQNDVALRAIHVLLRSLLLNMQTRTVLTQTFFRILPRM